MKAVVYSLIWAVLIVGAMAFAFGLLWGTFTYIVLWAG